MDMKNLIHRTTSFLPGILLHSPEHSTQAF